MSPSSNWLILILVLVYTTLTECINLHGPCENHKDPIHQAFSVMNAHVESASTPVTVPFQNIVTNIGEGFDQMSSIFLAADDGEYFFAFNYLSGRYKYADVRLSVNGEHRMSAVASAGENLGSIQGILTLKCGDRVFLELQPDGMIENSYMYLPACFSGYHLNKTSAFTVARTSPWPMSGVFPFNEIITNIGNGYDPASHKFTAPTSGVYLFFINYICSKNEFNYFQLFVNDTGMVTAPNYNNTGQNCVILPLKANEKVWINNVYSNIIDNATFTGHLLFELDSRAEKIAFSVGKTSDTESSLDKVRILFDHEFINEGLGYYFEGMLFEAPVDGIYVFFFNGVGKSSLSRRSMHIHLEHSNRSLSAIYSLPYLRPTGANHIIIHLLQFESVWLDLQSNKETKSSDQPFIYTTFSGYLLYSI